MRNTRVTAVASLTLSLPLSAALAQTTLNMSEDLVRVGAAPANMTPHQPSQDSGPRIAAAGSIRDARRAGP